MNYSFKIIWEATIEVDAETEDEAWNHVHDSIDYAWSKGRGEKDIVIMSDDGDRDDQWGLFDTDPEEEDITNLAVDYGDLF